MIGNQKTNPKKPIKRCTLEVIAEENELETVTKNTFRVGPKRESNSKTTEHNFTPFLSSWGSRSAKTQKSFTSTDKASKGTFRQQYESLKSDYKELFEYTREEEISKQSIIARVEELQNECQKLRCQAEENSKKLKLECKNAEQMKTDYEYMLETQNQTFKMREKELLEIIEKCALTIEETDMPTSMKTEIQSSAINTFEYEEISEKLQSFEKQNKYLQSSKEVLELQNKLLEDTLAEMKVSFSTLELQHNELKIRNNLNQPSPTSIVNDSENKLNETEEISSELTLELNKDIDELCVTREKRTGTTEGFDTGRKESFQFEKQLAEEKKSNIEKELRFACKSNLVGINLSEDSTTQQRYLSANNEIIKMLHNLQNVIQFKSETKDLSNCCSGLGPGKNQSKSNKAEDSTDVRESIQEVKVERSNEYEDGSSDNKILNLLQICLAQVNAIYRIKKRNTENRNILIKENDSLDNSNKITLDPENGINSIKQFGNNNINMSDAEKINKSNVLMESVERSVVEDSDLIIQNLKLRHENDRTDYTELQEIYENTHKALAKKNIEIQVLLEKNANLLENIEKHSQRIEYEKLSNSLLERDEIRQTMRSEQTQIETGKKNSFGGISYLKSLVDKQNQELQKLCYLLTDSTEQGLQKTENQSKHISIKEYHAVSGSQRNNLYENEEHIKNNEFDKSIFSVKEKLIALKYENENLKGAISKINNHVQDMKIIFINYKQINVKETQQQIQTLKSDILKAKNGFEQAIKLLNKDIQEKNQLIDELQKKIDETNNNLKLTKEKNNVVKIMKDDNSKTVEEPFKNDIKEYKNDNVLTRQIDNSISEMLSEHIHKIIIGIKEKEEEQPCDSQQTELENIKSIGNWKAALIQERNMIIVKGHQLDRTVCQEKNKLIQDKTSQCNYNDGSEMNINKVTELLNWNFNIEDESGRKKIQNVRQERNNETAMTDEYKKEDKWKLLRTREHDSRRNIDLNTLCSETTVETCNNCENVNSLNQKLKTEVAKIRNRYETRNIKQ